MIRPKISVIMPAYNHEHYVGEAMESVLNQSFTDFEFIIINDGSTDKTDDIIRSYSDKRIRYFVQENQDAYNAINRGMTLANGEYVAILNSDDKFHPERLSTLICEAEKHGAMFIVTNMCLINSESVLIENQSHPWFSWYNNLLFTYERSKSLEEAMLTGNLTVTTSNFFFNSDLINKCGMLKPYRYAHDYDFAINALIQCKTKFMFLKDAKLLFYRVHEKNTISESLNKLNFEIFQMWKSNIAQLIENEAFAGKISILVDQLAHIYNFTYHQVDEKDQLINQHLSSVKKLEESLSWLEDQRNRWKQVADELARQLDICQKSAHDSEEERRRLKTHIDKFENFKVIRLLRLLRLLPNK